jgi:uncharacterized protein (DUF433 family)
MTAISKPADLYGGQDPLDAPSYSIAEAAQILRLPKATAQSWVRGRNYPSSDGLKRAKPLVEAAKQGLSFRNLVELHVLCALRRTHHVEMSAVRKAIRFLQQRLGIQRPLADQQMMTDGRDLFVERYGQLLSVSQQGQLQMKQTVQAFLERVERDSRGVPIRLFPFTRPEASGPAAVEVNPRLQFGRPCLTGTGIPVEVILDRYLSGDSVLDLAQDYGQPSQAIEEAIRYEFGGRAA